MENNAKNMELLNALRQDKEFMKQLEATADISEAAALFQSKGIEISEQELSEGVAKFTKEGELTEEALAMVSGGIGPAAMAISFGLAVAGVYCGAKFVKGFLDEMNR